MLYFQNGTLFHDAPDHVILFTPTTKAPSSLRKFSVNAQWHCLRLSVQSDNNVEGKDGESFVPSGSLRLYRTDVDET